MLTQANVLLAVEGLLPLIVLVVLLVSCGIAALVQKVVKRSKK